MAIVTLTSDMGLDDPYVATVKGRILRRCSALTLVDVSHGVRSFDTAAAAFALRQAYPHFPADTIHWVGVASTWAKRPRDLIVHHGGQYFLGPDDGLFSLLFDGHPEFLFALRPGIGDEHGDTGIFADTVLAAGWLAGGGDILAIADQVQGMASRTALRAPEDADSFRANVIHIDRFGNAVLNVDRPQLAAKAAGRPFVLRLRRNDRITTLSTRYAEVEPGERLCRFNAAGFLEISINQGDAAGLLGLSLNDNVIIAFEG